MISPKQKKILAFPYTSYDALICDGAIRSGKTSLMTWAFVKWAMDNFDGCRFGVCGKTVDSASKNIIVPLLSMTLAKERYNLRWHRTEKTLEIRRGTKKNIFEVFGGKDESSYTLIQGRTLAGVLLDEVALMPQSFVKQALSRCSVQGSKLWFNCNPEGQMHWFKVEWIDQAKEHNALHLHFTLDDNPGLSEDIKRRYERDYSGVFYDRYIRGLWVAAEGLIYDMFNKDRHVMTEPPKTEGAYYVSSDFGIQNATVFLLWQRKSGTDRWVCLREYYYSGRDEKKQKTCAELVDDLQEMLGGIDPERIIIDPSALALITECRKRGYCTRSADNDVLNGISDVGTLLKQNKLLFTDACKNTIREFAAYVWDEKSAQHGEDRPIKENDHAMDAVRYFARTMRLVKKEEKYKERANLMFL